MRTTLTASLALLGLLALGACDGGGSTGSSSSGGASWEARFAKGDASAVKALAEKGSSAVPTVRKLLQSDDQTTVQMAAMTVKKLGDTAKPAMPELLGALERFPDQPFVVQAVKAQMDVALPHILTYLKTGSPKMQAQAAKLLNGVSQDRTAAIDPLLAILKSGAPEETMIEAMGAIASIGVPADAKARPVLQEIQAQGGKLGTQAGRAIERLDSAQKRAEIRREEGR